jgi:hypothetical protein
MVQKGTSRGFLESRLLTVAPRYKREWRKLEECPVTVAFAEPPFIGGYLSVSPGQRVVLLSKPEEGWIFSRLICSQAHGWIPLYSVG